MRNRYQYLPIAEAQVAMVLGADANAVSGGSTQFSLPAGHVLTEDNLFQLGAHHVEFLFVQWHDTRTDEQVAVDAALAARRMVRIFDGADLSDPTTAALFDQVLGFRST